MPPELSSGVVIKASSYDQEKCFLAYTAETTIFGSDDGETFIAVKKGEGKEVATPFLEEQPTQWVYKLAKGSSNVLNLGLIHRGCWSAAQKAYFDISVEVVGQDAYAYKAGAYIVCHSELLEKETEVVHISGPVYSVEETKCSNESWPICEANPDGCIPTHGKIKLTYKDRVLDFKKFTHQRKINRKRVTQSLTQLKYLCIASAKTA